MGDAVSGVELLKRSDGYEASTRLGDEVDGGLISRPMLPNEFYEHIGLLLVMRMAHQVSKHAEDRHAAIPRKDRHRAAIAAPKQAQSHVTAVLAGAFNAAQDEGDAALPALGRIGG